MTGPPVPDFPLTGNRRTKPCQYGIPGVHVCGFRATTRRRRPSGETWDVCDKHATDLDRIERLVTENADLLERLRRA